MWGLDKQKVNGNEEKETPISVPVTVCPLSSSNNQYTILCVYRGKRVATYVPHNIFVNPRLWVTPL